MAALVCDAGPDCHRIKKSKKPALYYNSIQVHKKDDLTGKVFRLCDLTELKLHKSVYELTAAGEALAVKKKDRNVITNPKNNLETTRKNNEAKTATMLQAQHRGMAVQLTGPGFKDRWLQAMHKYSRGTDTKAKATKAFMKGNNVGFIFAQGRHRGRKEKAGIFQPRGEKKTPPVVVKDTGECLGIGGVEDKFHQFLMYSSTNKMNVQGVEEAGTHFCGITKGYPALRTNTTLLNQNAGGGGRDPCENGIGEVWLCIAKKEGDISASKLKINPCYAGDSTKNVLGTAQPGTILPGVDAALEMLISDSSV